jgi:hypothetical protein
MADLSVPQLWDQLSSRRGEKASQEEVQALIRQLAVEGFEGPGGQRRPFFDRAITLREGDASTASDLMGELHRLSPKLGELSLVTSHARQELFLQGQPGSVPVNPAEVLLVETESLKGGAERWWRRSVTLWGLMEATNRLLCLGQGPYRYLPIGGSTKQDVYVGVTAYQAMILDEIGLWDGPVAELASFAWWRPRGLSSSESSGSGHLPPDLSGVAA